MYTEVAKTMRPHYIVRKRGDHCRRDLFGACVCKEVLNKARTETSTHIEPFRPCLGQRGIYIISYQLRGTEVQKMAKSFSQEGIPGGSSNTNHLASPADVEACFTMALNKIANVCWC